MPAKKIKKEKKFEMGSSEEMQESFQNDRTVSPDPRMFEQEDQTISYEIPEGRQAGGMSCPYRRKGAKSNIQGVKDIQVKGGKFIGCK